ncbi:helix-turn-helix transcriptional regulator [Clostridium sp. FAM 1755]|uniref:WYL domain-containing protein n=2 Tax=Clostridium TaxID=1485 RepID=A0A6M0T191_CLOBO|nr:MULTISPECIES: WYL domain-containing protein [Clostridium]NFA61546.1 WYL domain-containing protein [Clostridium botulinum]KOR23765.1 transcriptional regulator [Clostridium sp. L74]MDS1004578.1 WYL domain-containing protein [Clostridium sporogenes]NFI74541.1 WYL domain-containing protein [Clostridium sporogenes]NFL71908.1 WYL domain-containing protein [Clostridium sporogenes]
MSKISHILQLLIILQYKEFVTAGELSDFLMVDKKTIYRYINSLNLANIPIHAKKGRYGGFYIDKNFYMKSPELNESEIKALLMAGEILTEENGFIYEKEYKTALGKIKNNLSSKDIDLSNIYNFNDFRINSIGNNKISQDKISQICNSIMDNKSINISYFSINRNEITFRKIDPYDIIFKYGKWYIVGYCYFNKYIEIFDINRIKDIKVTEDTFVISKNFSINNFLEKYKNIFTHNKVKVELKFNKNVADFIRGNKWYINEEIKELENGEISFKVYVENLQEIKRWILGFGKDVKVIEPKELELQLIKEISELSNIYN